jgi:hypothetical protein
MKLNITDIHGTPLSVGDEVLVYLQRYEREQEPCGVWVVDQTKPMPVLDVPMARGTIVWDEHLAAYLVRYTWTCRDWEGYAATQIGGGEYAFERTEAAP